MSSSEVAALLTAALALLGVLFTAWVTLQNARRAQRAEVRTLTAQTERDEASQLAADRAALMASYVSEIDRLRADRDRERAECDRLRQLLDSRRRDETP